MPPKEDVRKKPTREEQLRSKSADSRWNAVGKNLSNAVSRSLPTMNKKVTVDFERFFFLFAVFANFQICCYLRGFVVYDIFKGGFPY